MAVMHFDLRHARDPHELRVNVLGETFELTPHDPERLAAAAGTNLALGALPEQRRLGFSHAAEVHDDHLPDDRIRWIQVVRPTPEDVHLDECVLMSLHLPERHLRAYHRRRFERYARFSEDELRHHFRPSLRAKPRVHSGKLAALGVEALPEDPDEAIEVLVHARHLVTTTDTAASFVIHHPHLNNVQPATATAVMNDHVLPDPDVDPDQFNAIQALSTAIEKTDPWSPVVECRDKDGNPVKADYELRDEGADKPAIAAGQQLHTWDVAQPVMDVATAPIAGACRTASDDHELSSQTWNPTPGTTVLVQDGADAALAADGDDLAPAGADAAETVRPTAVETAAGEPKYKWTVDDSTIHHGVQVKPGTIKIDASDNFSVDVQNWYMRTLYVGYQLLDERKQPVGGTHPLYSVSSTTSILGIPVPIDPTALELNLQGHGGVRFLFGSLGTSDWDEDVSLHGALLTGWWNYGVPTIFLIAGQVITGSQTYARIMQDKDLVKAIIAVGAFLVTAGEATALAVTRSFKYLVSLANTILCMVVKKGMEVFAEWLLAQVAAGQVAAAFGPVGWVFKGAAALMNIKDMAITTGEVLASPATVRVTCSRSIDVGVTMHPDPRHGESGRPETAVWPAVADRYVATLVYRDGTNRELRGELPKVTSGTPVKLTFQDVPADGQLRIIFGVYSPSGWLAGTWQSDWTTAKPTHDTTLDLGNQAITESLVPLAGDTQYVFKERIAFATGAFAWQAGGAPPATTHTALDCGPNGTLCELVDATFNNSAAQLGYAWRSSGQNLPPDSPSVPPSNAQLYALQNLSVLADPGSRRIAADVGLTNRPAMAYAPSTNPANKIDETNFVVDPRAGGMHLRQVSLDGSQSTFGLGAHDLRSWGSFPLENVDAAAVHPSNAVIACSWKSRKLMILPLPAAPAPDDKAPSALMVSGEGIREGLTQGPVALAVAPDGRILVLETLNRRVQAFDTKGNPVPSFTPGPVLFSLATADVAPTLDKGEVPDQLQDGLHAKGAGLICTIDASHAEELDSARFNVKEDMAAGSLLNELSLHQIYPSYDREHMDDPKVSAQIKVVKAGSAWTITDPRGTAWQVLAEGGELSVYPRIGRPRVEVRKAGHQWLVVDGVSGAAFMLSPSATSGTQTDVRACQSWFPLRGVRDRAVTYLDVAVEAQGHVYVLSHQLDGADPADYLLDVYAPDGRWLFRTPDPSLSKTPQNVVAGKIAVDIWRNLYAVTFETLHGPNGDPQPGVAHWTPTPPLFTLPLTKQTDFEQKNIGAVQQDFAGHGITLSGQAFVTPIESGGAWQVKDGATVYDVYRSGDGLQVYSLSA